MSDHDDRIEQLGGGPDSLVADTMSDRTFAAIAGRRRPHRWLLLLTAAIAVIAVAAAVVIARAGSRADTPVAVPTPAVTAGSTTVAASTAVLPSTEPSSSTGATAAPTGPRFTVIASRGYPARDEAPTTMPDGEHRPARELKPYVGWATDRDVLFVLLVGSGSCTPTGYTYQPVGPQDLLIDIGSWPDLHPSGWCTMDLSPFTATIVPPPGIRSDEPLTIRIDGAVFTLSAKPHR